MSRATLLPVLVSSVIDDGRSAWRHRIRLLLSPFDRATVMNSSWSVWAISPRSRR